MKKFLAVVLLAAFTTVSVAQESVKLRLNYKKGDSYVMKINMNQNMPAMSMNMKMNAKVDITDVNGENYLSETKFTKIDMGMMQGGMQMAASTEDKTEDLDVMSQQIKGQLDEMLTVIITSETNNLGEVINVEAAPNLPGMDQMKNQIGSVTYPEKALKIGDSWTDEKTEQGMVIKTTYKVKSISKDVVGIDITGEISGIGEGKLSGSMELDRASGIPKTSTLVMEMNVQGQDMKTNVSTTMEKVI